jgi:hypothetical protein
VCLRGVVPVVVTYHHNSWGNSKNRAAGFDLPRSLPSALPSIASIVRQERFRNALPSMRDVVLDEINHQPSRNSELRVELDYPVYARGEICARRDAILPRFGTVDVQGT